MTDLPDVGVHVCPHCGTDAAKNRILAQWFDAHDQKHTASTGEPMDDEVQQDLRKAANRIEEA